MRTNDSRCSVWLLGRCGAISAVLAVVVQDPVHVGPSLCRGTAILLLVQQIQHSSDLCLVDDTVVLCA